MSVGGNLPASPSRISSAKNAINQMLKINYFEEK